MRLSVIALCGTLLSSCIFTTHYGRLRPDAENFDQANAHCQLEAHKATVAMKYRAAVFHRLFNLCMRAKGWEPTHTELF